MSLYKDVAQLAAQKAGDYLLGNFGKNLDYKVKESQHSIVTQYDLGAEEIIVKEIKKHFPSHSILSEEKGFEYFDSEFVWVIDPLDGSSYYARGIPTFSVSIALINSGEIVCGVIYCPAQNELFTAEKGMGAFLNGIPVKVSATDTLNQSVFSAGHRYLRLEVYDREMRRLLQSVRSIRGGGSCAQELCYLACGRIDVILTVNQSFWDYAAGALILEEAGGKITTTTGEELSVVKYMNAKFDLLASNKILHLESMLKGI